MNGPTSLLRDLVVLVPDKNMEAVLHGILQRYEALGLQRLEWRVFVHVGRDPGCLLESQEFLRPMQAQYRRALVLFDREGSGRESMSRTELEAQVEQQLQNSGWGDRARAICLDPELELWVWSPSPHVARALGWDARTPKLRDWLAEQGFWERGRAKPSSPKKAMESALRQVRRPRSSAIYGEIASAVSFHRCSDPSFHKLRETLSAWFRRAG